MSIIKITLKQVSKNRWQLFAPKGHTIGSVFFGKKNEAKQWAEKWISGLHGWVLKIEGEEDEKKD